MFPWAYIATAILGSLIGAAVRALQRKEKDRLAPLRVLAEGVLVGVVTLAAALVGLSFHLLPADVIGTEVGAFILSALAGYVGLPMMDRLVKLVFKPAAGGESEPAAHPTTGASGKASAT